MQSGRRPARVALHFGERQRPDLERWVKVPSGSEAAKLGADLLNYCRRRRGDLTSKALYLYLFRCTRATVLATPGHVVALVGLKACRVLGRQTRNGWLVEPTS